MNFMVEYELTEAQRESREPIGNKGLYRMYMWKCSVCNIHGKKMPFSEAVNSGYLHCIEFKHEKGNIPPVKIIGGNFNREELYHD